MKKIFTFSFLFLAVSAIAQVTYSPGKTEVASGNTTDFTQYVPEIVMNDPANLQGTVSWRVIEVSYPSQWDQLSICNPVTCPVASVGASGTFTFNNGNAYYKATFIHNNYPGYGFVKFTSTYNGITDTLTLGANVTSTGISTIPQVEFSVFPNPATTAVNIQFAEIKDAAAIQLTDMTGRACYAAAVRQSSDVYSLPILQKGTYILNVVNETKQIIGRKKLVIAE